MSCASCGNPLRPDAAFCDRCGAATQEDKPSRTRVAVVMVLAVALFVVIAMIGIRGLLGPGGGEDAADGSVTATAGGSPSASQEPSGASGSDSATSSGSVTLPSGARPCAEPGADGHELGAWAGTKDTSCPFTVAVRDAYAEAAPDGGDVTVTAHSSVTGKTYSMACTGQQPVTCRGGTQAVIYLAR